MTSEEPTTDIQPAEPPTPLGLYQLALQRGIPASELGKLLDLHERVQSNRSEAAYTAAMVAAQAEMPAVVVDKDNAFLGNKYARLETIQERCKPVYTRHGFSLSWGEGISPQAGFVRIICDVMHREGHTKQYFGDYPLDGTGAKGGKNMNALQGRVSSNTYAQRDMLRSIFNITIAGMDKDGNEGSFVTAEQIKEVNTLLNACEQAGKPVNFQAFLKWLDVEALDKLPQRSLEKALAELRRKLKPTQPETKK